ncbi:hypothetical protein [Vulcanisaeta thermophila]|uniref:hypothetical protein n=1 Tax=Vulcanisaeta thermophila TaxID=867917 RepID=UPI0008535952|nr:hypothetical protein [Vulcanisaeta thermophila]
MPSVFRLLYLYIKQRYSPWFLAMSVLVIAMELLGYLLFGHVTIHVRFNGEVAVPTSLLTLLDFVIIASLVLSTFYSPAYFTKSEVDFALVSSRSPMEFLLIKVIGDEFYILILLTLISLGQAYIFSVMEGLGAMVMYVINIALLSFIISGLTFLLTVLSVRWRILLIMVLVVYLSATTAFMPVANVLYSVVRPNIIYTAALVVIFLLMIWVLRGVSSLIYVNIYSMFVSARSTPGTHSVSIGSSFNAVFISSLYSQLGLRRTLLPSLRVNSLVLAVSVSLATALFYAYAVLRFTSPFIEEFLVYYMNFYLTLIVSLVLGGTLAFERVWVDFLVDAIKYARLRMGVRLINTYLVTLPWILTNLLTYLLSHRVITLLVVFPLISYPPILVPLSWILMAISGIPQVRELGLEHRPVRFNVSGAISGSLITILVGAFFAPSIIDYLLQVPFNVSLITSLIEVSTSILIYLVLMYSPISRRVWYWFMDKLSTLGYV